VLRAHPPPPAAVDRTGFAPASSRVIQWDPAGDPRRIHGSGGRL